MSGRFQIDLTQCLVDINNDKNTIHNEVFAFNLHKGT